MGEDVADRLARHVDEAKHGGSSAIIVTCSTLGEAVDALAARVGKLVDLRRSERGREAVMADIRQRLADQYNLGNNEPNIQVWAVDLQGDRALTLRHTPYQRRPLDEQTDEVLKHVARLWGFDVRLETVDDHGAVSSVRERKWEKRNRI